MKDGIDYVLSVVMPDIVFGKLDTSFILLAHAQAPLISIEPEGPTAQSQFVEIQEPFSKIVCFG